MDIPLSRQHNKLLPGKFQYRRAFRFLRLAIFLILRDYDSKSTYAAKTLGEGGGGDELKYEIFLVAGEDVWEVVGNSNVQLVEGTALSNSGMFCAGMFEQSTGSGDFAICGLAYKRISGIMSPRNFRIRNLT